jgi:hypothetical protein
MVHPVTGETISSYKKLMHDLATIKVWQTAFGKDFGGMMQRDNKTCKKGMDTMFIMTHNNIKRVLVDGKKLLVGTQWSTIPPRKRIYIAFTSQLAVT